VWKEQGDSAGQAEIPDPPIVHGSVKIGGDAKTKVAGEVRYTVCLGGVFFSASTRNLS